MNWIDLCLLSIIGLSVLKGYRSGLIRQATALAAIVIAGFLCGKLSGLFEYWIISSFEVQPRTVRFISIIFSFAGILTAVRYTGSLMHRSVKHTPLALFNRLAGAILAPTIALLLLSYLFVFIDTIFPIAPPKTEEQPNVRTSSRLYLPVRTLVPTLLASSWQLPSLKEHLSLPDSVEKKVPTPQG